ncbi:C4-dicarboxylate ABC transporter [Corynebacterium sp. HMSC062E11]|uniref:C4-dicarboxylate transporter DcuA n=5 Tax=Corynebacterium TaxID=1716 RepID=A0ABU9UJ82_9CORY|nr:MULTISPECIES: anaerobic C4-dicarboxylate transporter [Corynebacterium]MBE7340060.1 anaerobic C4-dicarboxylate transporter [Corynebacterium aurimucosum]MBE7364792.1 anaerobic C4-dicarboxylate transporter [Corynebacterium aurimucosum]MCG7260141.1 anaerobic C4-dicarboxylate transporter [Corynebacterium aurimucosum]MCL8493007.1 anaerobic C4-dicarboxylate transporter [Corynebacterium intestinale]MCP1389239.1 anaerobic C4-dicarboxylate transporter [Corynebacterium intestinale]
MVVVHIIIVLAAIYLGARIGSIGIGMAGGLGVLLLGLTGVPVTREDIPFDVIGIIMTVIAAIAAMQRAGGMDYLVYLAEKFLRKNPKRITFYAPIVTWLMTVLAGTGHTAFSTLPVIVEVAKEGKVRPSRPLSISVVASQMAICASPISAAVVLLASLLEPMGVGYLQILAVLIPATFLSIFPAAWVANRSGAELEDDPVYQERKAQGLVKLPQGSQNYAPAQGAKTSVIIFLVAIVIVMLWATLTSSQVGLIEEPTLPRNEAIMTVMLTAATLIVMVTKVPAGDVLNTPVFKSGMSACICVLGVAWLGTTLINHYMEDIQAISGSIIESAPWLLAIVLFFAAALLYSQAATTKALMPAALALGVNPLTAVAAFPAVSALFILPTYPTLLAAVEMDDTGSTRIGKAVFNHPFIIPGTVSIVLSVLLCYAFGAVLI